MAVSSNKLATVDKRPFFEKALTYGVQQGLIDSIRCEAIVADGAKGTVQVAEYFGTSHLFTALENARKRIVHLVSLYLEDQFGNDLDKAARSLCDNSFLSHSRGGNDLLKKLHAMPESAVFDGGVKGQTLKDFQDERTLAKPLTHAAYHKELARRGANTAQQAAARWFAQDMAVPVSALDSIGADAVIRTGLLRRLGTADGCPNRQEFAHLIQKLRAVAVATGKLKFPKSLLDDVPDAHREIASGIRREIEKHDAPLLFDAMLALDEAFNRIESRYFLRETGLEDVDAFEAFVSTAWQQLTKGKEDPYSRLTLFMCLAAGLKPKTTLTAAEARSLIRKVRKDGFQEDVVSRLIATSAPFAIRDDLLAMWEDEFFPEAQVRLLDASDEKTIFAMQFLSENCNIKKK
ncbi:MAG: hypothetical protein H7244_15240 [Herminiimonas sp.]|nr:hypothetical protein [Herminiimonas sp.]